MELLNNVYKMSIVYKIYCEDKFGFIQENNDAIKPLLLLAKAQISSITQMTLELFEGNTLRALDQYLSLKKILDFEMPALWALLWQLLFIYRDLLKNQAPRYSNAVQLLDAVSVFYASHFQTTAEMHIDN